MALADSTRVRVARLLAVCNEEACLCELVDSLLEPKHKLSKHVKVLRQTGLLTAQKDGRWVYHRLVEDTKFLKTLVSLLRDLPFDQEVFSADENRFRQRMTLREQGRCRIGIQNAELADKALPKGCCPDKRFQASQNRDATAMD